MHYQLFWNVCTSDQFTHKKWNIALYYKNFLELKAFEGLGRLDIIVIYRFDWHQSVDDDDLEVNMI